MKRIIIGIAVAALTLSACGGKNKATPDKKKDKRRVWRMSAVDLSRAFIMKPEYNKGATKGKLLQVYGRVITLALDHNPPMFALRGLKGGAVVCLAKGNLGKGIDGNIADVGVGARIEIRGEVDSYTKSDSGLTMVWLKQCSYYKRMKKP